ncbi:MAG TPA: aspartate/glutamate racemase family protein [Devosiaceae bacterium]|nr:aspartate/glutamate racemase family protein [Devosiaceae bacterium]
MPKKIGMLTPSSNTLLEPVCSRMLQGIDEVTCHYSRFPVTHISLAQSSTDQFRLDPMLRAAELLAHAEVDVIAWNGASGSWLGLESDRVLCDRITEATGIPATTATLALIEAARANAMRTCHLITPYSDQQNQLIAENYGREGITVVNARGANRTINKDIGSVPFDEIDRMFAEVMHDPADGVCVPCTNFPLIWSIEDFEARYGCVIYDTIGAVMWKSMLMVGADPAGIAGWGALFRQPALAAHV